MGGLPFSGRSFKVPPKYLINKGFSRLKNMQINNKGSLIPAVIYKNADVDKLRILTENKDRTGIYKWEHKESGRIYVGSAINLSKRFSVYFSKGYLEKNKSYINSAILLHGYSAFSLSILEYIHIVNLDSIETKNLILKREQYFIDMLNPGYNILKIAGSSLGYKHLEEDLLKISLIRSETTHTEETKDKISTAMTGENHPLYGKTHNSETRAKISIARKGENHPMFGKNHSAETLLKMSLAKASNVKVINNETNETTVYSSNYKAAEALDCSETTIRNYLKNKKVYKGKYLFLKD